MNNHHFSRNVIVLSIVSFLNDIGGETIKKAIPLFLTNVLGVKPAIVGLVEGVTEATPQLLQPVSGYLSDVTKKRKAIVAFGQLLRSFMMFLVVASTWPQVLVLRFLDRTGKGVASSPRDALVSDSSDIHHVGRSFGLTRMFDNAGAVVGLVIASIILLVSQQGSLVLTKTTFEYIVLLSVIPLFISVILLTFAIKDVPVKTQASPLLVRDHLGNKYYVFLLLTFLFTLGNSSDAFLILKSQQIGFAVWQIFLLLAGYSLVSAISGLPLSSLSDRIGRKKLLVAGWFLYSIVYAFAGITNSTWAMVIIFILYGLYFGATEGSAKALVSDLVIPKHHGVAFGAYNMVVGVTLFFASLIAGLLWQTVSPGAPFYFGSVLSGIAAIGLLIVL